MSCEQGCSVSMIGRDDVLLTTAAHCVTETLQPNPLQSGIKEFDERKEC